MKTVRAEIISVCVCVHARILSDVGLINDVCVWEAHGSTCL